MGFAIRHLPFAFALAFACVANAGDVGFYRVAKDNAGAWRLIDPAGNPKVWLGVDHVKFNGFRCEAEDNRMHYREANIKKFVTRAAHCCAGLKGLSPLRGIV